MPATYNPWGEPNAMGVTWAGGPPRPGVRPPAAAPATTGGMFKPKQPYGQMISRGLPQPGLTMIGGSMPAPNAAPATGGGPAWNGMGVSPYRDGSRYNAQGYRTDGRRQILGGRSALQPTETPLPGMNDTVDYQPDANGVLQPVQPRATGGPVTAGQPYLVGEKGPELIVPRQSGTVVPNEALPMPTPQPRRTPSIVPTPPTAPNETLVTYKDSARALATPYGYGTAVLNPGQGPAYRPDQGAQAFQTLISQPESQVSNPGAEALMARTPVNLQPRRAWNDRPLPDWMQQAQRPVGAVQAEQAQQGVPPGVNPRDWQRFQRSFPFVAMSAQGQMQDAMQTKAEARQLTREQRAAADGYAGTLSAVQALHPDLITPELANVLGRLKPAQAQGVLSQMLAERQAKARERAQTTPSKPFALPAPGQAMVVNGKVVQGKEPVPAFQSIAKPPPGQVLYNGRQMIQPDPVQEPFTPVKIEPGQVLSNGKRTIYGPKVEPPKQPKAPDVMEVHTPGAPGQPDVIDYRQFDFGTGTWVPMKLSSGTADSPRKPSAFTAKFSQ